MSRFEYPRLTRSEILSFLVDSQIFSNVTAHHLADPTPDFVTDLYTQLLIYLDSFQEEDGQMEFAALEQLENPDFHVEMVPRMNLYSRVKEVVASLHCPTQFTVKDLLKPNAERTEIFVSAILNFCFHKDNKMNLLKPIVEELNLLDEQQKEWEAKLSQLNAEIAEYNEARERELPLVQEVDRELKELRQTISELNNHQMSLRTTYRKLKDMTIEMDAKIFNAERELVQSVQANAELRSKIVQSPDKLQGSLEEKKLVREEAKNAENLAKQSFEDKNAVMDVFTKVSKKLSKHLMVMQKIQEQVNSAKAIDRDFKALKSKLSDDGILDKSHDANLIELQGREEQLDQLRKQVEKESHTKCEEATREFNNVKMEIKSRKHELEERQRKVESVVGEVDSITSSTNSIRESCAAEQQELLRRCEDIMKEFHQYSHSIGAVLPVA
ncbi:kinetochore protein NUF2 homolog [Eucalyptus grandis]|uniref:kinetochore protein NUF2 homolog n=1 Tax=Eucalyptus grandis TaxID=71139 RepID=UPI00192EF438|nr:kinetochore protein NUF2 homolog [Eucalyptus grandis]